MDDDLVWDPYSGVFADPVQGEYIGEFIDPDDYSDDYGDYYNYYAEADEITNPAGPGEEGYGWRYFTDGTVISPTGTYYYQDEYGGDYKPVWSPNSGVNSNIFKSILNAFKKPASEGGGTDWRKVTTALGGIAGITGLDSLTQAQTQPSGYQGGIPSYTAVRERVQDTYDPTRRPGSGGMRYFSDINYVAPDGVEAARTAAQEQAAGLAALNLENPANQTVVPLSMPPAQPTTAQTTTTRPASSVIEDLPVPSYNRGGVASLKQGRYLGGPTDGMADKLNTTIDGKQPAALSHGEFVIPADVVSHLGNGNSTAGADKLYDMMDKIRYARTGNKKQGKEIDPNKFLPT